MANCIISIHDKNKYIGSRFIVLENEIIAINDIAEETSSEINKEKDGACMLERGENSKSKTTMDRVDKVSIPEQVSQFRPIALCNTVYKSISKIIVNRMKTCTNKVVTPNQTGFIPNINIHENIVVKGKKGYFAIKYDLAKAYDKMSWKFVGKFLM